MFKPMNDRIASDGDNRLYHELRHTVNMVWDGLPTRMIHNTIRLLPETIKETIRLKGGNHFKIPHHYDKTAEPTLTVGPTEQDWVDQDEHDRDATWRDPPDGLVGYEEIPEVWPDSDHCDPEDEPPSMVGDVSACTGNGSAGAAASNTSVEHVPTFAGHGEDDPDDMQDRFIETEDEEDDSDL